MADPRTRFLVPLLVIAGAAALYAQAPFQTREPPLADERDRGVEQANGWFDPDEPVRRAEHRVPGGPAPATLPGGILNNPGVVPAQYTRVVPAAASELPTPVVTLNIEGSDVAPTGQAVVYKLHVRNVSRARAHHVLVKVTPPKNVTKVKADPAPTHDDADTIWEFKTLEPGASRAIELVYTPTGPDVEEVKIQARVQYDFGRGLITRVAPPSLSVKRDGPETLVVGDTATYRITVTNTGKVTVRDIEVKELPNKALVYEDRELSRGSVDGRLMSSIDPTTGERTWTIPALGPGQTRVLEYRVKARDPGRSASIVLLSAPGVPKKEIATDTEVLTANLQMRADGPASEKGTVGQAAIYKVVVENKGSADLRNVVVRCTFPPDMRVTRATTGGQSFRDSVQWTFKELKKGDMKELSVGLTTTSAGSRAVQFTARADRGSEQRAAVKTDFAGVSSLDWDTEVPGTDSVGKELTYRIVVANRGSAAAEGVEVRADLPNQVELIDTKPGAITGTGPNVKEVVFQPMTIPPGKKTTLVVRVKAKHAGEARAIFWLKEQGKGVPARHDKITNITAPDTKSPSGPPPKADRTNVGSSPRE